jgi:hypothetical protein
MTFSNMTEHGLGRANAWLASGEAGVEQPAQAVADANGFAKSGKIAPSPRQVL